MIDFVERPNRWPWPPIVFALAIIIGLTAEHLYPLPWPSGDTGHYPTWLGALLIAIGLLLDVSALFTLQRNQTTVMPNKSSDKLVTGGPFALSRNPIYLGNTCLTLGIACWFAKPWLIFTAIAAAAIVDHLAIRREEAHLAARFADDWLTYKQNVRRWF